MNFQTMSKQRKFVLIAAALGLISMFLSWGKLSIFGYSAGMFKGTDTEYSFIPIACFIGAGIIAFMGNQSQNVTTSNWIIILLCGAIAALFAIWTFVNLPEGVSAGIGIYLAILASIGVLLGAFLFRSPNDNIKDGFNSLKKDIGNKMGNAGTTNTTTSSNTSSNSGSVNNPDNTNPPL